MFGWAPWKGWFASESGGSRPVCQQGLNSPPTCQEFLITCQIVDVQKVPGQAKRRPLHNQGALLSPDLFEDDVEGTEGRNSDPLRVEENGRAQGLRLKEGLGVSLHRDRASGPAVSSATVERCWPGDWESFGKELPTPLLPTTLQTAAWQPQQKQLHGIQDSSSWEQR